MPGLYIHNPRTGVLTAAGYNADHQNHINNAVPLQHDDYSVDVTQMRAQTDPGEVGTESLPTTQAGEFERLRFAIREIKGTTHWYQSPAQSLISLIPSGTLMLFQQTSAPVGWTKQTTHNDKGLRVVSGAASSGGAASFTTVFGAGKVSAGTSITTAQMPSHQHGIPDPGHVHGASTDTQGSHDHAMGAHISATESLGYGLLLSASFENRVMIVGADGNYRTDFTGLHAHNVTVNGAFTGQNITSASGSSSTHNHSLSLDLQYVDLIIASKD